MAALFLSSAIRRRIDRVAALRRARWRVEAGLLRLFWRVCAGLEPRSASAFGRRFLRAVGPHRGQERARRAQSDAGVSRSQRRASAPLSRVRSGATPAPSSANTRTSRRSATTISKGISSSSRSGTWTTTAPARGTACSSARTSAIGSCARPRPAVRASRSRSSTRRAGTRSSTACCGAGAKRWAAGW